MKALSLLALSLTLAAVSAEAAPRRKAAPPARQTYDSYDTRASSGYGSAAAGHNMAGCGLGSMVVEDKSKWAQVGAAFLNGTGMQTFGISFGTSNCTEDGVATAALEKDAFVEANLADLRRDVAAGEGEYLSSLASFYGCKGDNAKAFGAALHRNQDALLTAPAAQATQAIDGIVSSQSLSCQG